jgi:Arc/MetJ-type ribon-helix-helix transcriptional regulator
MMLLRKQTSLQVTEATRQQAEQLVSFGSFTDVVRIAIDRMWNDEHKRKHFELAQAETGVCPWCGWNASED